MKNVMIVAVVPCPAKGTAAEKRIASRTEAQDERSPLARRIPRSRRPRGPAAMTLARRRGRRPERAAPGGRLLRIKVFYHRCHKVSRTRSTATSDSISTGTIEVHADVGAVAARTTLGSEASSRSSEGCTFTTPLHTARKIGRAHV